ncbi:hypothetical protein BH10PSE17_BH10PSE17_32780 [soil metagenome]
MNRLVKLKWIVPVAALAWAAAACAVPDSVRLASTRTVEVKSYVDDKGANEGPKIGADKFPIHVYEVSADGRLYRVKVDGKTLWIAKFGTVENGPPIDAQAACSTVVAQAATGATRNANEGCARATARH